MIEETRFDTADASEAAGRRAVRLLRDEILAGRLAPDARIRQESLAEQLGMSRIPVREALRQLEGEGLVVLENGRARVARLDFEEYNEIYLIRERLEPLAAAESAPRITDAEIEGLRRLVTAMNETADDPGASLEVDRRFHLASYAPSRLPRLLSTVEGFWNRTQPYRRAFMSTLSADEKVGVHAEHMLIFDAFARRDAMAAEHLVRLHIRRTRLRLADRRELFRR